MVNNASRNVKKMTRSSRKLLDIHTVNYECARHLVCERFKYQ